MRITVLAVLILSACFMQEVSCALLRTAPKDKKEAVTQDADAKLKDVLTESTWHRYERKQHLTVGRKHDEKEDTADKVVDNKEENMDQKEVEKKEDKGEATLHSPRSSLLSPLSSLLSPLSSFQGEKKEETKEDDKEMKKEVKQEAKAEIKDEKKEVKQEDNHKDSLSLSPSLIKKEAKAEKGRVLFGSLTSPRDWLALDQMLQHQLRESATSILDHRILYIGGLGVPGDHPPSLAKQRTHAAMVERVQSAHLVDEVVNLKEVNLSQLARRVMDDESANALDKDMDYNKAMVAFLVKCLDGYDHCAWLDGDIFVHRGIVPWIDDALQRHIEDPQMIWSMPRAIGRASDPDDGHWRFDTRWFMYHREGLQRFLPLKAPSQVSDGDSMSLFENLMHHNAPDVLESSHGGSWVAHPPVSPGPPDNYTWKTPGGISFQDFMKTCGPQSLSTMISIVEQGSERGEMAFEWFEGSENMAAASWMVHIQDAMRPHCRNHRLGHRLLGPIAMESMLDDKWLLFVAEMGFFAMGLVCFSQAVLGLGVLSIGKTATALLGLSSATPGS